MASNTVYVGNLSWETDSDTLESFFTGLSVTNAEVQYYGNGTRSKGWGLVSFSDASDVKSAIDKFNDVEMGGRKLIVREDRGATPAPTKTDIDTKEEDGPVLKVFVGNLSWDTTADTLEKSFSACGKIEEVDLKCRADGRSKGWAVVTFATVGGAQNAVDKLDGGDVDGRAIRVEFQRGKRASSKKSAGRRGRRVRDPKKKEMRENAAPSKNIYVGNLPWSVTSQELKEMFGGMSPIDAEIKQGYDGRSRGYGIVSFGSIEQASKAINAINGTDIDGRSVVARFDLSE